MNNKASQCNCCQLLQEDSFQLLHAQPTIKRELAVKTMEIQDMHEIFLANRLVYDINKKNIYLAFKDG